MKLTAGKCIVAYWMIALLTFGYIASAERKVDPGVEVIAVQSVIGGVGWPLYWTWEGFSIGRQALKGGE
ncbi:hypothetical protein [Ochrobactrum sp. A-1]|uniref:hypothetical protein n=1 Tax=Ochrobactrum sp. A-1 TaxID=2920940 RepID=UPI001F0AAB9C|nr:hypothetical protein [Ochrobactrum sp. A-1]